MKISISFLPAEKEQAAAVAAFLKKLFPGSRQRETQKEPPRRHIYVTIRESVDNQTNV